jgi:hypothetical protein
VSRRLATSTCLDLGQPSSEGDSHVDPKLDSGKSPSWRHRHTEAESDDDHYPVVKVTEMRSNALRPCDGLVGYFVREL